MIQSVLSMKMALILIVSGGFLVDVLASFMFYCRGHEAFRTIESVGIKNPLLSDFDNAERGTMLSTDSSGVDDVKVNVFGSVDNSEPQTVSRLNLTMCSAVTHLGGDTMRTLSVFVAAAVTSTTSLSGNLCDAWAAIAVTVTIIILVVPLVYQIWKASYLRE